MSYDYSVQDATCPELECLSEASSCNLQEFHGYIPMKLQIRTKGNLLHLL